jgi:hypothetical protein
LARKRNREKDFLFIVPSGPVDTIRSENPNCGRRQRFNHFLATRSAWRRRIAGLLAMSAAGALLFGACRSERRRLDADIPPNGSLGDAMRRADAAPHADEVPSGVGRLSTAS